MKQGDSNFVCLVGEGAIVRVRAGRQAERGEDIKVPDVVWLSVHLSWIIGKQLEDFVQEVA